MAKIKIDYLMPVLVTYEGREYVFFVDYARSKVYSLAEIDNEFKDKIYDLILKEINNDALKDIQSPGIINNPRISQVIADINSDAIIQKFNNKTMIEEKTNE